MKQDENENDPDAGGCAFFLILAGAALVGYSLHRAVLGVGLAAFGLGILLIVALAKGK